MTLQDRNSHWPESEYSVLARIYNCPIRPSYCRYDMRIIDRHIPHHELEEMMSAWSIPSFKQPSNYQRSCSALGSPVILSRQATVALGAYFAMGLGLCRKCYWGSQQNRQRPVRSFVGTFWGFSSWGLRLEINEMKTAYPSSLISSDFFSLAHITTFLKSLYEIFAD